MLNNMCSLHAIMYCTIHHVEKLFIYTSFFFFHWHDVLLLNLEFWCTDYWIDDKTQHGN